jgi:hypothetical protein
LKSSGKIQIKKNTAEKNKASSHNPIVINTTIDAITTVHEKG